MSNINLLPWREELQQVTNRKFFAYLGVVFFVVFVLVLCVDRFLDYRLKVLNLDLKYVEKSYDAVQAQIKEIQNLKADKDDLLNRVEVIRLLGVERIAAAQLLDMIPRVLPDSIYLTQINRLAKKDKDDSRQTTDISQDFMSGLENIVGQASAPATKNPSGAKKYTVLLKGVALGNNAISSLLKNLSEVSWVSEVQLSQVKELNKDASIEANGFEFTIQFFQNIYDK